MSILLILSIIIFVIIIHSLAPKLSWLIWVAIVGLIIFMVYEYNAQNNNSSNSSGNQCIKTGCSGQICSSEPKISTCEWKCENGCYRNATCKKINNKCQWEVTDSINKCLDDCKKQ